MMYRIVTFLLMLSTFAASAGAVSFDCNKASNRVEKMICSDYEIGELDDSLSLVYRIARTAGVMEKSALKAEQVKWIKQRNRCQTTDCVKNMYLLRIDRLETYVSQKIRGSRSNFTGTYKLDDGEGEVRILHLPKGKIYFYVTGQWMNINTGVPNVGSLEAWTKLKNKEAVYISKEFECFLKMTFGRQGLRIIQKGYCGFGHNVRVDGNYTRMSKDAPVFSNLEY